MLLAVLFLAAVPPPPLSLDPFMDEKQASEALDAHMICLGTAAFDRRKDTRDIKLVAADVVNTCRDQMQKLRASLADVYSRKPNLLPAGKTPQEAADLYVTEMNNRMNFVIQEGRQHK